MADVHQLHVTTGPAGLLFECDEDGCGRRLVIDRDGAYTVIDRGDPAARHSGSVGGVRLDAQVVAQP